MRRISLVQILIGVLLWGRPPSRVWSSRRLVAFRYIDIEEHVAIEAVAPVVVVLAEIEVDLRFFWAATAKYSSQRTARARIPPSGAR